MKQTKVLSGKTTLKSFVLAATIICGTGLLTGCEEKSEPGIPDGGQVPSTDSWASLVNETEQSASVNENTLTYGSHTYTVLGQIDTESSSTGYIGTATASVQFSNIPSGYKEFEAVYKGLLGKSLQGTAAMIPMAIEIYARNASTGERCFKLLCNSESTVNGILRILKQRFNWSPYSGPNDSYVQRYMAAALLKGATPENAYTPSQPYTVEMAASANKPQKVTGGTDTFLYIFSKAWDGEQRQVEIFLPNGSELYQVYNCPSVYTHCKDIIGTWGGLK